MTCDSLNFMANAKSPVGVWSLDDICVTVTKNPLEATCADSNWDLFLVEADVTREFREDGTASSSGSLTLGETWELSSECLDSHNDTCAEVQADLLADVDYETVECAENAGVCKCTVKRKSETIQSGTLWKVDGDKLHGQKNGTWDEGSHYMATDEDLVLKDSNEFMLLYAIYSSK